MGRRILSEKNSEIAKLMALYGKKCIRNALLLNCGKFF